MRTCRSARRLRMLTAEPLLSRDSWFDQRKHRALLVEFIHGVVDRLVERVNAGKGLMSQVIRLEVVPDNLDVVEFRRILGQPLDGEPM